MQHISLQIIFSLFFIGLNPSPENQAVVLAEICDNGLDDDGDGAIDLNDPDCDCASIPLDYIPNPSFESYETCPSGYSQMIHCQDWVQPGRGTPDFFHECGFMGIFNEVVQPLPEGSGCVAFSNSPASNIGYKEYVGACLDNPLLNGNGYRLNFSIGFKDESNSPPTTFSVFGATSCMDLDTYDSSSEDCPATQAGWVELASREVSGDPQEWVNFSLEIHPQQDIHSLILGGDCEIMLTGNENYYFLDKLDLYEIFSIPGENGELTSKPFIRAASGHPCMGNLVLETHEDSKYTYQWYRNGIAIPGATQASYAVPAGQTGDYQVRVSDGSVCANSELFEVRISTYTTRIEETLCTGESLDYLDSVFTTPGLHTYPLTTGDGCDSIIEIDLSFRDADLIDIDREICEGDSFHVGPNAYDQSGVYEDTLQNTAGCDSIVRLSLEVIDQKHSHITRSVCQGNTYVFGGEALSQAGSYTDTLLSVTGCDSVIRLDLEVLSHSQSSMDQVICKGETFPFNGMNLNTGGIYRDTVANHLGCDSVITLDLTVQEAFYIEETASICEGSYYQFNGRILTDEGVYEKTFTTTHGCDSTVRLELSVYSNNVFLGPDLTVRLGESVFLSPEFEQANIVSWHWESEKDSVCTNCPELDYVPRKSGWVKLTVKDANGCSFSDQLFIRVTNKTAGLYIPNAFSPNGDGINDYFRLYASDRIRTIDRLTIFSRRGQVVFDRNSLGDDEWDGWDGRFRGEMLQPGVYIYLIEAEYLDGTTRQFKGDVTLIR